MTNESGCPLAELLALGVSHKTAPLELRERLALTEGRAVGVLRELPDTILTEVPEIRSYEYFVRDDDVVLIDRRERRIVEVIE